MSAAGLFGYSFSATADFHPYGLARPVWNEDGTYDYSEFDGRMSAILESQPDAWVIPRLYIGSPPWWDQQHPDELVGFRHAVMLGDLGHGFAKTTAASFASDAWLVAAKANLTEFIRHAMQRGWAERIPALILCSGTSEEWVHVGAMEGHLPDAGMAARARFRGYLAEKYGTDGALSHAWRRDVSLENLEPPDFERRREATSTSWIDPRAFRDVIDFNQFLSLLPTKFLIELSRTVTRVSNGAWKVGAFHGYFAEMAFHPEALRMGCTLGLSHLLASNEVAFLASPSSYARRDLRSGASMSMLPTATLRKHGMGAFHESDIRTHVLVDDAGYGRTESLADTLSMQVREAGVALARGMGFWWFDMTGTFHDEPAVCEVMRQLVSIARQSNNTPASQARAALVVDEEALEVLCGFPDRLADALPRQLLEIAHSGLSCEIIRLSDLDEQHGYDCLVFPVLERVEPLALARVRAAVRSARLALFTGRTGLAPTSAGPPCGIELVTGLPLTAIDEAVPSDSVTDDGIQFGRGFWSTHDVRPVGSSVHVVARRVRDSVPSVVLGTSEGGWTAYALEPPVPAFVLSKIYATAGLSVDVEGKGSHQSSRDLVAVTAGDSHGMSLITQSEWQDQLAHVLRRPIGGRIHLTLRPGESTILQRRPK